MIPGPYSQSCANVSPGARPEAAISFGLVVTPATKPISEDCRISRHVDAQVAVDGLGGVEEDRRRAGAAQRGGHSPADVPGLADSGHHHLSRVALDHLDRTSDAVGHAV